MPTADSPSSPSAWSVSPGKRLFDIGLTLLTTPLWIPAMIAAGLVVFFGMGRPILFRQTRPGLFGKLFTLYKFRTMRPADPDAPLSDAERSTPVGRLLRRTSLDELPELLNILKGDMSLVGPRPLLPDYLARYSPEQAKRHLVRPGLTGLAQTRGRNALDWERVFELDVEYVRTASFRGDLAILAATVRVVFFGSGVNERGEIGRKPFTGNDP